jgi:hypothetical protein
MAHVYTFKATTCKGVIFKNFPRTLPEKYPNLKGSVSVVRLGYTNEFCTGPKVEKISSSHLELQSFSQIGWHYELKSVLTQKILLEFCKGRVVNPK